MGVVVKNQFTVDWTHQKQSLVAPWECYLSEHTRKSPFRLGALVWCDLRPSGMRIS